MPASSPGPVTSEAALGGSGRSLLAGRVGASRRKEHAKSEEELRIFGDYSNPSDAVSIVVPGRDNMPYNILGGGFKPVNTLVDKFTGFNGLKRRQRDSRGGESRRREQASFPLQTAIVAGDNVRHNRSESELSDPLNTRSTKRRRVERQDDYKMPGSYVLSDDDDNNILEEVEEGMETDAHKATQMPPPPSRGKARQLSAGSSNSSERRQAGGFGQPNEYRVVEGAVRPNYKMSPRNKARRGDLSGIEDVSALLDPSPALGRRPDQPLEVSDDESSPRKTSTPRGPSIGQTTDLTVADVGESIPSPTRRRKPEGVSGEDTYSKLSQQVSMSLNDSVTPARPSKPRSENLRHNFRRDTAIKLGQDSPDELAGQVAAGVPTLGRRSPGQRSPERSPERLPNSKRLQSQSNSRYLTDIPSTSFSKTRALNNRTNRIKAISGRTWGLVYVHTGNAEFVGHNLDLEIHHDPIREVFTIRQTESFTSDNQLEEISPSKVDKIHYSSDSGKTRLTFHGGGPVKGCFDIEFMNPDDAASFVRTFETEYNHERILPEPGDRMDQFFLQNLKTQRAAAASKIRENNTRNSHVTDQLNMQKDKRTRMRDRLEGPSEDTSSKINTRQTFISELQTHANQDLPNPQPPENSRDSPEKISAPETPKLPQRPIRSTRSSAGKISENLNDGSDIVNTVPYTDRYSVKHGLGKEWDKSLVYPPEGKKKTSIDFKDLERLDEGELLNDNIISFYLRYIEIQLERMNPDVAKRIYFFNTFFYPTLTNAGRGRKGINYESVERWTRAVDLFTYDFVVVPVNESFHWYLALICNLPKLQRALPPDEESKSLSQEQQTTVLVEDLDESPRPIPDVENAEDGGERSRSCSNSDRTVNAASKRVANLSLEVDGAREVDSIVESTDEVEFVGHHPPGRSHNTPRSEQVSEDESVATEKPGSVSKYFKKPSLTDTGSPRATTDSTSNRTTLGLRRGKRKSLPPQKKYDPFEPIIITLDSLDASHPQTIRYLKDYLYQEGKTKRHLEVPIDKIKGMTAKQIPTQNNFSDCGVYLLGYMRKFADDPRGFVTKILQRQFDVEKDWSGLVPAVMRSEIRDLLQQLHKEQRQARKQRHIQSGKHAPKDSRKTSKSPPPSPRHSPKPDPEVKGDARTSDLTRAQALDEALPIDEENVGTNSTSKGLEIESSSRIPIPNETRTREDGPSTVDINNSQSSVVLLDEHPRLRLPIGGVDGAGDVDLDPVAQKKSPVTRSPARRVGRAATRSRVMKNPSVVIEVNDSQK